MIGSVAIAASIVLVLALAAGSVIDIRTLRLPDWVTLPLLAAGLALHWVTDREGLPLSLLAAALGFASLWAIAQLYRRVRGLDGLGLGDAKLLAAAGAWLGPLYLAPVVLIAALSALLTVPALHLMGRKMSLQTALPFGPFLSIGFFLCWCLKQSGWLWP